MVKIYMEYIHAAFFEYCGGRDTVTISAKGSQRTREHEDEGRTTSFWFVRIACEASYSESAIGAEPIDDGTALAAGCRAYGDNWSGIGQGVD